MTDEAFRNMLAGQGLTTAHILYQLPDFESLLQTYVWQDYDTAPDFPKLFGFLDFWTETLDGPLHSVRYSHRTLISPGEIRTVQGDFRLN